jgi:hypothetical protein
MNEFAGGGAAAIVALVVVEVFKFAKASLNGGREPKVNIGARLGVIEEKIDGIDSRLEKGESRFATKDQLTGAISDHIIKCKGLKN